MVCIVNESRIFAIGIPADNGSSLKSWTDLRTPLRIKAFDFIKINEYIALFNQNLNKNNNKTTSANNFNLVYFKVASSY